MGPADAEIIGCDFSPRKHATGMFTFGSFLCVKEMNSRNLTYLKNMA